MLVNPLHTTEKFDAKDKLFYLQGNPIFKELTVFIQKFNSKSIHIQGLAGSSRSILTASLFQQSPELLICLFPEKEEAAYFYNDLATLLNEQNVLFFPSSFRRNFSFSEFDNQNIVLRTEVLNKINHGEKFIIVSYSEALCEKVISKNQLHQSTFELSAGNDIGQEFVMENLIEYSFERVDFVYEPGQYSHRGSIIDIFSYSAERPYRLDFDGDTIQTIRTFDPDTQLSIMKVNTVSVIPNLQHSKNAQSKTSFFDFIPTETTLFLFESKYIGERIRDIYQRAINNNKENFPVVDVLISGNDLEERIGKFKVFEYTNKPIFATDKTVQFHTSEQADFNKNFGILIDNLNEKTLDGYTGFILSDNPKQLERLETIINEESKDNKIYLTPLQCALHEGFIDHTTKQYFYTDHQIFGKYHRYHLRNQFANSARESISISELKDLHPGDYVVHIDHGIGRFGGLEKIDKNGKQQEAIKIVYQDNDVIYASIHSLHRISKYKGKEGEPPKMHKLGSGAWQRTKDKAKSRVKDIAKELISLYARRKAEKGFMFAKDTYMQQELEASFIWEDTPDQVKATNAFKQDMESDTPMDRLICGDVGFGKTEIAVRAAFKAVTDNKQVAVLVPTTILALQHFKTFSDRLKNFPCNVEYISRLKSTKQQKEIVEKLALGKIDIIIGTHKIVGKEIKFKDLGLLVIDEEQKFGVGVKEKLKEIKVNVDTLTLTATPIPRTLQFSLLGARDLSILNTPPPNRYPIQTELHTFNEDSIKDAIGYELTRGGQVFYIHNRVQSINDVAAMLKKLEPKATICVAHGQMEGDKLEKIMMDFTNGEYDILVATSIIENGLDIPNANTIIIDNAHLFGLSDLHQMRGRVGRSNKKAFCYLLAPPYTLQTPEARRRLKAIEDFAELGSGFNIALQDLDIRGAGDMLGAEQSGFISEIGIETYSRILEEAMTELREGEFKDVFADEIENANTPTNVKNPKFVSDCQIETDLELLIPESYISSISERMRLYKRLDNFEKEDDLQLFATELKDRFGDLPKQAIDLMDTLRCRWIAMSHGIDKIILKQHTLILYFGPEHNSPFYETDAFTAMLALAQKEAKRSEMKQNKDRLSLKINNVKSIEEAYKILKSVK